MPEWTKTKWFANTLTVVVVAIIAFGMVNLEVLRRARREFREGEKYYAWYLEPAKRAADLAALKEKKKISENEYEHLMEEDMYKEAVIWWQTVGDFYAVPHNRWYEQSEERIWTTGQEHEARGSKAGIKKGRDDLEHALMSYKAIVDSYRPMYYRRAGKHLEEARKKVAELEAKGLQWP